MDKKKVLLISYDFPPIGGGGVQRNIKFMKYLSSFGWDTSVLTIDERDYYVYDYSFLEELKDTKIYKSTSMDPISVVFRLKNFFREKNNSNETVVKTETNEGAWYVSLYRFIRNWFLIPDGQAGWIPFAYRKGKEAFRENKPDVLMATFPIPSNAFVTYKLAKKFNIPYIIDFRDGWLDDPYNSFPSFFHKMYHSHHEKRIVLNASYVVCYDESLKKLLVEKYPSLLNKIEVIRNGFDPADFLNLKNVEKPADKIRIVYSGSVYIDRRETFKNFIEGLKKVDNQLLGKLEIVFVGDKLPWIQELVSQSNLDSVISFLGYFPHQEALNYLTTADAFMIFLKPGDFVALTGKVFEYLFFKKPIIACVEPEGACSMLLQSLNLQDGVCNPSDPNAIASTIINLIDGKLKCADDLNIDKFSRLKQAEQLDAILKNVIN